MHIIFLKYPTAEKFLVLLVWVKIELFFLLFFHLFKDEKRKKILSSYELFLGAPFQFAVGFIFL